MRRHYKRDSHYGALFLRQKERSIQIGTLSLRPGGPQHKIVSLGVIAYLKLFLTHAALAPATNQMGGRNAAGSAPCFP